MASADVLSQTLHTVTKIKLEQLHKQKAAHEAAKTALLQDAAKLEDSRKRALLLINGAEKLPTMKSLAENPLISVENFRRFVEQSERDSSLTDEYIQQYESVMRNELDVQSSKYEFASLYGKLVNEWISAGEKKPSSNDSDFVSVGREEMHKQRAVWEDYVFKKRETDAEAITAYLESLFTKSAKDIKTAFTRLREKMRNFQKNWDKTQHFDKTTLTKVIKSMLRGDVLSDSKRATLRDFLGNEVVLAEIADVLNWRMESRASFTWEGVAVIEQRRNLNGRYRFYPDEDLLQMIFLHYIGSKFAVQIRSQLMTFFLSDGVQKSAATTITKEHARRREWFLERPGSIGYDQRNLAGLRDEHWRNEIFLDQLPVTVFEERGSYGDSETHAGDSRKSPAAVMQKLLHLVQTDIIMQTRLGNEVCCLRTDLKWFGPSVPHNSTIAVLRFFGIKEDWIEFFEKVLTAPISFADDDADVKPRNRANGTPIGVPIADFFNETMLFVLDFAVNQKANGERLYRLHDDIWLWGGLDKCVSGWAALTEFAKLMGLAFNEEKTGCVRILRNGSKPAPLPASLPKGDVVWGFLKLDPISGRFLINEKKVDSHIAELRLQLQACGSVFDFIQAWNLYGVRFFRNNLGRLANCYSRKHVDAILATFQRIQEQIFPDSPGGVSEHLKKMLKERFGVSDVTDGCLYYPISLGGLELHSPFVDYYLVREQLIEDPDKVMDEFLEKEEAAYRRATEAYDRLQRGESSVQRGYRESIGSSVFGKESFMPFEEYTLYRERTSTLLVDAYDKLMGEPGNKEISITGDVRIALENLDAEDSLSPDQSWLVQLYAKGIMKRFGGLRLVDEGLLPMGLMALLRQSRFKWQG